MHAMNQAAPNSPSTFWLIESALNDTRRTTSALRAVALLTNRSRLTDHERLDTLGRDELAALLDVLARQFSGNLDSLESLVEQIRVR